MRLQKAVVPILAVSILSLGGIALAQSGSFSPAQGNMPGTAAPHSRGSRGQSLQQWAQQLNLSADQVQKIQSINEQYKSQLEQSRTAIRQARQQFQEMMEGNSATDAQIRDQHQQLQNLQQQAANARFEKMLAIRNVLSPEQRTKSAELMRQRRQEWRGRMHNMNPSGDTEQPTGQPAGQPTGQPQ